MQMAIRSGGCLVWEDITVELPASDKNSAPKRLLDGLDGFARPGRITALMGPSGSGKTTLLDSLAGRLSGSLNMSGKVTLNGRNLRQKDISYVTQEDIFIGTLSVRETILYSANLRLPPSKSTSHEIETLTDSIIHEMGLQDCANKRIGNWHSRGISGGEKKRLSIGLALITQPYILLLDEPTTGLDSAAAFFVIQALKSVAGEGRIVAFSVHQPSSEVYELLDDLLLISAGETVFFGEAKMAVKFFGEAGFPCPTRRNPCDHFLRCVNSDFDRMLPSPSQSIGQESDVTQTSPWENMKTSEIRSILIREYKHSTETTRTATTSFSPQEEPITEPNDDDDDKPRGWKQLETLTRRSFTNMYRDFGYYWLRMAFYISVSMSIGTMYLDIGTDYQSILARESCDKFIYGFMICLSVGGIPFFTDEMKVFYHEKSFAKYSEAMFVVSNFISSFPFVASTAVFSATILYFMLQFKQGLSYYAFLLANLYGGIAVMEGCMMAAAAIVPHMFMATGVGTGFSGIMIISSPFLRTLPDMPKFFWRYPMSYISFSSWAMQGQFKNDLLGMEFDPMIPGDPKLTGEMIVRDILGSQMDHSKWLDMAVVIFLSFCYRLIFYLLVKFKGQSTSLTIPTGFKRARGGKTGKVSKVARDHIVFSKRHQPIHSLSSQEGLGSPLP